MSYKVCHFSTVHSPNDPRVFFKECVTLARNNWDVHLVIQDDKDKIRDGVNIHALPKAKSRRHRFFILSIRCFFKCLKIKADIYHFHDPELMRIGVWLALFGKRVVYDVHEDYPKQILDKSWLGPKFIRKILSDITWLYEQFSTLFFKGVVTATEEIAKKFPQKKTIVLYNYSSLEFMDAIADADYDRPQDKMVIMYAGGLTRIRGIKEVINAIAEVPQTELWLFGKWESEDFKRECEALKGWDQTKDFGFKPMDVVFGYLKLADIGVHLVYPTERHLIALPTKAYEFLTYSKPVLLTDSPFWREVFGETMLYCEFEHDAIVANLKKLINDPQLRTELGQRGRKLVEEKYSWENEYQKLDILYKKILKI